MRVTLTALASAALLSLAAPASAPSTAVPAAPPGRAPRSWSSRCPTCAGATCPRPPRPTLWRLVSEGAAGALSVKSSYQLAGCADGLLTLGAGDRAAAEPSVGASRWAASTGPPGRVRPAQPGHRRHRPGLGLLDRDAAGPRPADGHPRRRRVAGAPRRRPHRAAGRRAGGRRRSRRGAGRRRRSSTPRPAALAPPGRPGGRPARWRPWSTRCPPRSTVLRRGQQRPPGPAGRLGGAREAHLHVALARGPGFAAGLPVLALDQAPAVRRADRRRADGAPAGRRARAEQGGRPPWESRRRAGR